MAAGVRPARSPIRAFGVLLQSITQTEPAVCFPRSFIGSTGCVSPKHLPRAPASKTHEVLVCATSSKPLMRELVPETVRM